MNAAVAEPITTDVIRNFVISCAEDMNAALWRSAFSAIIYEGRDSAVALLDEKGNMLGQSTGVPLFVGAIDACVKLVLERYGEDMAPGDIFILNDSYLQGTHLHDITAVGPLSTEANSPASAQPAPIGRTSGPLIPARPWVRLRYFMRA